MRPHLHASLLLTTSVLAQVPIDPPPDAQVDELMQIVDHLAADEMRGRATGSPEQIAASNFVAQQFATLGLEPIGDAQDGRRTWLQWFPVEQLAVAPQSKFVIDGRLVPNQFLMMTSTELATNISGPMQFCGLGRTTGPNPDVAVGADLTGKIAIAVVPTKGDAVPNLTAERRFGISFQTYRQLGKVATALSEKGAAAVVFVQVRDATGLTDCLSTLLPSTQQPRISLPMPVARQRASSPARAAPSVVLSLQASKVVLEALHLTEQELDEHLDDGTGVAARTDVPATLDLAVAIRTDAKACNVVAVLRGSDPKLAHQAVLYTAHVDHIGCRMDGAAYNGANDNASGVAGLIGVARAFAAGPRPRRSIVFLVTAGEELGLWGSRFFVDHPAWPIDDIVANINFEMIGRTGRYKANEFAATPSYRHPRFSSLGHDAAQIAAGLGITILPGDEHYRQSDHFPFAERGIPALSIGDGNFVDYHLVTDDAGPVDGRRVQAAMRVAAELGRHVAMDKEKPSTRQVQAGW